MQYGERVALNDACGDPWLQHYGTQEYRALRDLYLAAPSGTSFLTANLGWRAIDYALQNLAAHRLPIHHGPVSLAATLARRAKIAMPYA